MAKKKVLVVDDNREHVDLLRLMLEKAGMAVIPAYSGAEALRANFNHRPDVILLDLMMPDMDGYTTAQRLREVSDIPILVISAKHQTADITKAFAVGADDYVPKPYNTWELIARIQACFRRTGNTVREDEVVALSGGDLIIDPIRHRVVIRQQEIKLTKTEFELLLYFARNRGRVLTHSMILDAVWGHDAGVSKDTLKQFILSIRKKIERDPRDPRWLINEHGIGYSLVAE